METGNLFCVRCQEVTSHKGSVDANGEYVFECLNSYKEKYTDENNEEQERDVGCTRFLKMPSHMTFDEFKDHVAKHQQDNTGQVTLEQQEKTLSLFMQHLTQDMATEVVE